MPGPAACPPPAQRPRHALSRRRLLAHWPLLAGLPPGAGLLGCGTAAAPTPAGAVEEPVAVAPGLWLWPGQPGEIDPANGGRVGNAAFVVGSQGVLVVDSGTSLQQGQALLAAVRRTTPLPVRGLLLSHARQEFVFGAAAFQDAGVPVLMGQRSAQLMAARCEGCLKVLQRLLGEAAMRGTRLVKPDLLVPEAVSPANGQTPAPMPGDIAALLASIGRPLRLLGFGHSSGPGDVAVLDEATGTLIAGGLADVGRIPDVQDADLPGWQHALTQLQALPLQRLVGGHGPAAPAAQALDDLQAYLRQLDARTRALAIAGAALSEVPDACTLPAFTAWDQWDTIHRRNASILFLRHERALLRE